jgi:hypothetical protein
LQQSTSRNAAGLLILTNVRFESHLYYKPIWEHNQVMLVDNVRETKRGITRGLKPHEKSTLGFKEIIKIGDLLKYWKDTVEEGG